VVVFEGDASLMMTLQELETAARSAIPVIVVVENDGGHGSERISMRRRGDDSTLADFSNPDFAAVARSLGASGHSASSASEFREVLGGIGAAPPAGPVLIDVRISPEESDVRMTHVRSGGPI
jgi:acetolactate synthase-1/2/3 large subunit